MSKYSGKPDHDKIHVVCARCGAEIKCEKPYTPAFDRFDVRVNFFGWECVQSIGGEQVRSVSRYEIAFDHCGCVKLEPGAPWEEGHKSIRAKGSVARKPIIV